MLVETRRQSCWDESLTKLLKEPGNKYAYGSVEFSTYKTSRIRMQKYKTTYIFTAVQNGLRVAKTLKICSGLMHKSKPSLITERYKSSISQIVTFFISIIKTMTQTQYISNAMGISLRVLIILKFTPIKLSCDVEIFLLFVLRVHWENTILNSYPRLLQTLPRDGLFLKSGREYHFRY